VATITTTSYDDGEDVATDADGFVDTHAATLAAIRAIGDPATRRAIMILFVLVVLHGRVGR
jgi:hypothetical protein